MKWEQSLYFSLFWNSCFSPFFFSSTWEGRSSVVFHLNSVIFVSANICGGGRHWFGSISETRKCTFYLIKCTKNKKGNKIFAAIPAGSNSKWLMQTKSIKEFRYFGDYIIWNYHILNEKTAAPKIRQLQLLNG